jgi:hypothetical protein
MIQFFFVASKTNYSRLTPVYIRLVGFLTNWKPILVIVFLDLLSIVKKILTVDFPTYRIMFSQ